ncbi:uncharacterized protein LOC141525524 [Cotesia typhae]|uniref:uncharacterized protein LOC141525524 n=1 Tax=Cotesia typhae TaxID=2053667 RepID=UPI003D68CE2A
MVFNQLSIILYVAKMMKKGKNYLTNHFYGVVEKQNNFASVITAKVVPQASVSNTYDVKVLLGKNRNISNAVCSCKAGLGGKCKHVSALIHYVNSPESSSSKTSHLQEWGKPTQRQLLGYDKGQRMSKLFTPQPLCKEALKLEPVKITTANLPDSFANTPLGKMLKLEEKENVDVIPA